MSATPEDPILNSPFSPPSRHWALDDSGAFTSKIEPGRRRSEYLVPIAQPRRARQESLPFAEEATENALISEIRGYVERWRTLPIGQSGVTHETARLLDQWRSGETKPPLFFCQIEAVETIIWLEEVAARQPQHRSIREQLRAGNEANNPIRRPQSAPRCSMPSPSSVRRRRSRRPELRLHGRRPAKRRPRLPDEANWWALPCSR
jgi:type III restriction enzyme